MSAGTTRISTMDSRSFDMDQRDPSSINDHLQVSWDDVIGEPDGIHSNRCIWNTSYKCYRSSKNCCYQFLTILFAPLLAFCMGCQFACLAFQHIWCFAPCLRCVKINCSVIRDFLTIILQGLCGPCIEICGLYFSKIKVRYQKLPDVHEDKDPMTV